MIKLLLTEDNEIVRSGLVRLLATQRDMKLMGQASNGREVLTLLENGARPDVVIADLNMPEMDGIELTKEIVEHYPEISVIILTMHAKDVFVMRAFQIGAKGYVLKSGHTSEIFDAIRKVYNGGVYHGAGISFG